MDKTVQILDLDACLAHGVALTQGDGVVLERLMVDGYAVGCAYGILTAVALAYGVLLLVVGGEVKLEVSVDCSWVA